jgi:hypothetical protein
MPNRSCQARSPARKEHRVSGRRITECTKEETMLKSHRILCGDAETALATLKEGEVDLTVTSPAYFRHRDYGFNG